MNKSIELRDVGPVQRIEIALPEAGGIVVLRGRNGTGKTHCLQAVGALVGSGDRPVSRDGTAGAYVEGLGARLTVGRRASVSGELEVSAIDGEDPSLMVDPGLKAQDAADAERVKALLRLSRATLNATAFAKLVGGDGRLREICRESSLEAKDVPTMAASIKRDIEAAARKAEATAENLHAKALGIKTTLKEIEGGEINAPRMTSAAAAREEHDEAVRTHASAKATQEQNRRLRSAASAARAALAAMGEDGTDASAEAALQQATDLGEKCSKLRAQLARAQAEHAAAKEEHTRQHAAQSQRQELIRAIEASGGLEDIPEPDIEALARIMERTQAEVEAWAVRDKTTNLRAEIQAIEDQAIEATKEGELLRAAAHGTEGILLDAVRAVCADGMELRDGRLYVKTDRGVELFSELSTGERWRLAIEIATKAVGASGLLVVRQEAYEGLDPDNRRIVAEHARALKVVILTAEADDGDLRAETA